MRIAAALLSIAVTGWIAIGFVDLVALAVPDKAEKRIGAALLEELHPQIVSRDISALQSIASDLARRLPRPFEPRVLVLGDEAVNAFGLPGGSLLLTSGLLERAQDQEEVAFVLGHLLGHFRDREQLTALGRGLALALAADVAGVGQARIARMLLDGGLLTAQRFRARQEIDADRFAAWQLQQQYQRIDGAFHFFATLNNVGWPTSHFVETPITAQGRLRALNNLVREEGWAAHS